MKLSKADVKRLKRRGVLKEASKEEAQKEWERGRVIVSIDKKGNVLPPSVPPNCVGKI